MLLLTQLKPRKCTEVPVRFQILVNQFNVRSGQIQLDDNLNRTLVFHALLRCIVVEDTPVNDVVVLIHTTRNLDAIGANLLVVRERSRNLYRVASATHNTIYTFAFILSSTVLRVCTLNTFNRKRNVLAARLFFTQ